MSKVKVFKTPFSLRPHELVRVGLCLTDTELMELRLTRKVAEALGDARFRLQASIELVERVSTKAATDLKKLDDRIAERVRDGSSTPAKRIGGGPIRGGRMFHPAGTVVEKEHRYQQYNVGNPRRGKGQAFHTFRFLVVNGRGHLLWLEDGKDVVYRNPTKAALAATGTSGERGWAFFGFP